MKSKKMKRTLGFSIKLMVLVVVLGTSIPMMASTNDTVHISDSTIKVLVESELARRSLAKNAIEIAVDDHVVTLSGAVSTLTERERIEKAVLKTFAVTGVQNNLVVRAVADKDIAESVRKSVLTNPNYDVFDWIDARVQDGVVTLSGAVREPWRKSEFERGIMNIAGVSKIENQITVLPLSTYDDQIRIRAVRSIYGSSTLNRYGLQANPPIHVIVENGQIVLKGIVANKMDRQLAEVAVRNNTLAFGIRNDLQVEIAD